MCVVQLSKIRNYSHWGLILTSANNYLVLNNFGTTSGAVRHLCIRAHLVFVFFIFIFFIFMSSLERNQKGQYDSLLIRYSLFGSLIYFHFLHFIFTFSTYIFIFFTFIKSLVRNLKGHYDTLLIRAHPITAPFGSLIFFIFSHLHFYFHFFYFYIKFSRDYRLTAP